MYTDSYDNEGFVPEEVNDVDILQSKSEKEDRRGLRDKGGISCAWGELGRCIQRHSGKRFHSERRFE